MLQQAAVNSISPDLDNWSFTGGAQVGYNLRFGMFVLGLEADINYLDFDLSESTSVSWTATNSTKVVTSREKVASDYVATLRSRIGFVARGNLLLYGTGGLALSDQEFSNHSTIVNLGPGGPHTGLNARYRTSSSEDVGYVVGGGLEYAFTRSMTLKAEYQHLEFDNPDRTAKNPISFGFGSLEDSTLTSRSTVSADIVRIGVNWMFGGGHYAMAEEAPLK